MSSNVHDYPRFRAIHNLLVALWDKAVSQLGYVKREWEALQHGIEELAKKGLGLPESYGPEEPTPVDSLVLVLEGSIDGVTWVEAARSFPADPTPVVDALGFRYVRSRVKNTRREQST